MEHCVWICHRVYLGIRLYWQAMIIINWAHSHSPELGARLIVTKSCLLQGK